MSAAPHASSLDRIVRRVPLALIALGPLAISVALWRGLSHGRMFEAGSNNLALFCAGLALLFAGAVLRLPAARLLIIRTFDHSATRTPDLLTTMAHHPLRYVGLGWWAGIAVGITETAYRTYHVAERPWKHALWLGPLVYGAAFAAVGLVAWLAARRDRAGARLFRVAAGAMLALSSASWLFLLAPGLHAAAVVILSAGIGLRLSSFLPPMAWLATRTLTVVGPVSLAIVVAIMLWTLNADASATRQARARLGPPPDDTANVLLIVLDTVRASHLSLLGYQRPTTPNLERWARQGIVFGSAMSTAPWTLPSHGGMFTGRWAHELSARFTAALDGRYPTIAEVLRDRGYATAGFVANLVFTTRQTGLARGFDSYEDFTIRPGEALLSTAPGRALATGDWLRNSLGYHELLNRKIAPALSADFLSWLDGRDRSRPFFAFLNYFDAHEPYLPPTPHAARFLTGPREDRGPYIHQLNQADHADWTTLSPSQVAQERALYDGTIAWLDAEIGRLLDDLERRGVLSKTVVILTSDHGEAFGEHGVFTHGNNLYLPQLHVPLWILAPGAGPARVEASVSLRDLPATILDLAEVGGSSPFPGSSLARFWAAGEQRRPVEPMLIFMTAEYPPPGTPIARGDMRAVIDDPYHYILNGDGVEELYDYRRDPLEQRNLANSADAEPVLPRMRALAATIK